VISHAVTKGLDPNARMKDSGVEWLGEVPEGWEVKRLRFIVRLNPSKSELSEVDRDTEVSFLPMEAVGEDGSLKLDRLRPLRDVETGYTYFRDGDVTIAKITPCFENGKGAVMTGLTGQVGFGTTELIVARPRVEVISSEYLHRLFTSTIFRELGEAAMYGAGGQKRVPDDFVRDFSVALPPLTEQVAIEEYLKEITFRFDALIEEAQKAIELMKERRTALISAAVTGKIDVRGFCPVGTGEVEGESIALMDA
jgi:type I restriction enzyme S subunit